MLRCYNSTRLTNLMSSFSVINEYFQNIEIEVNSTNQCNIIAGSSYGLFSCTGTNMVDSRFPNFPCLSYSSWLSPSIQNQSVGNKKKPSKKDVCSNQQNHFFPNKDIPHQKLIPFKPWRSLSFASTTTIWFMHNPH